MDMFTRFNRKNIQDRQIDHLIGLCQGIVADGKVNQSEAEFLHIWLVRNHAATTNPVIGNLLQKIETIFEDGILDEDESIDLFKVLQRISGEPPEIGEVAKTSTLPVDTPYPSIKFEERTFLFTGTCAFGNRSECQKAIESLGGINAGSVSKSLNYLVLGTYVTDSWAHESFGRKIEKAVEYRDQGIPLIIVTEEHWANEAGL